MKAQTEHKAPPRSKKVGRKSPDKDAVHGSSPSARQPTKQPPGRQKLPPGEFQPIKEFTKGDLIKTRALPPPIYLGQLIEKDLPKPPELILGLLGQGSKAIVTGSSKSYKTFTLLGMSISVAAGVPWWGFDTLQGTVLYLNFEIQDYYFQERILAIEEAMDIQLDLKQFIYWGLRGHASAFKNLAEKVLTATGGHEIALVVVDPIYKGMAGLNENDAGDVGELLEQIDQLARLTGAAVVFGHHHSKGNQAGKEAMDASSGSGVWSRDPDTILTMRPHSDESGDVYSVDAIVRNFPRIDPFCVRWEHPLMVRADSYNPAELRQKPKGAGQYEKIFSDESLLKLLDDEPLRTAAWQKLAAEEIGITRAPFYGRLKEFQESGLVIQAGKEWMRAPRKPVE